MEDRLRRRELDRKILELRYVTVRKLRPETVKTFADAEELLSSQGVNNNSTCIFRNQEPNVISFYNDQQIREDVVEFPAGAQLVSRCMDIGKYAMIGEFMQF